MAEKAHAPAAPQTKVKESQVPEWEHIAAEQHGGRAQRSRSNAKAAFMAKLDSALPPHQRYIGMGRNTLLLVLLGVIVAVLVLIIGLAAGLSQGSSSGNLPLPSNADTFEGELTYFSTGLGACGWTTGQEDLIVSISHIVFDAAGSSSSQGGNSNENPLCGRMVRATRYNEDAGAERSVDLKVVDRCTGCAAEDLDTTLGAFEKLAAEDDGRVDVRWAWLDGGQN